MIPSPSFCQCLMGKQTGIMIYTFDGQQLHPYCALPSGGGCSYPAVVRTGATMLVNNYSSHEGPTTRTASHAVVSPPNSCTPSSTRPKRAFPFERFGQANSMKEGKFTCEQ